jgi:hypothetical protein
MTSRERIPPESILSGFNKCSLPNAMDSNEDDVVWQDCGEGSNAKNEGRNSNVSDSDSIELSGSEIN